MEGSHYTDN